MSVSSHHSEKSDTEKPEKEPEPGLESPDVCTKYTTAGTIANKIIQQVIATCVDGADIFNICKQGDDAIIEETSKVYNKKDKEGNKIEKGIGFPTSISVNEIGGNFSPLKLESKILKAGDVVKVELGVHIDGYVAEAGHTIIIPFGKDESPSEKTAAVNEAGKICDRRADVVMAAWVATQAAIRTVQVGNKNNQVTEVLRDCANAFKCNTVAGVLSHELKRNEIDGKKVIANKEPDDKDQNKVEEHEFEVNSAYTVDVRVSTGDGKLRESDIRHTLYKRDLETSYILKTAKARSFMSEVKKNYAVMPFSLRNFEDETCAKVGISEANKHKLFHQYPVMTERNGDYVACFKFTVLLLAGGAKQISGLPFSQENVLESQHEIPEDIKAILAKSTAPRKKRNKKKKDGEEEKKDDEEKKEENSKA